MKAFKLILAGLGAAALLVGCNTKNADLTSFNQNDVFDDNITLVDVNWTATPAGESTKIDRAFENAPPLIPHDISDIIPITKDMNMCVTCHMPEVAEGVGATAIPKSHLYSIRFQKSTGSELSQDRFSCTQCHVPQANVKPRVKNNFKADFRDESSSKSSNLLDVLNEGVR
ncbi:nitrate reductase cytochrome c-type subunit [Campylobacter suis]|uniref:Periplasmic nitrate reductase, electron transfer subunit n=1 Tax=Campylobacter suis TaxID=2790657 RepID=A0ABM8Q8J6_9BACT|nr:nitrate reductase cytochrome c-type subunit [Campylobacter suis]CAD7289170.1 hypothetical protein LMG8286_01686 [Campylobacter suis]